MAFAKSSVRQGEEKYLELYSEPKLLPYHVPTGVTGQQEHPARSIRVIMPEGGWDPCPFHSTLHRLWADYHGAFLLFRTWRAREKRQKGSLFLTGRAGVTGHCAYALSSTDEGPHGGAEAAVDHTNERWDRLY